VGLTEFFSKVDVDMLAKLEGEGFRGAVGPWRVRRSITGVI
jgi:hypothetical protein